MLVALCSNYISYLLQSIKHDLCNSWIWDSFWTKTHLIKCSLGLYKRCLMCFIWVWEQHTWLYLNILPHTECIFREHKGKCVPSIQCKWKKKIFGIFFGKRKSAKCRIVIRFAESNKWERFCRLEMEIKFGCELY